MARTKMFNDDQLTLMREMHEDGGTQGTIAAHFGCSTTTVSNYLGDKWGRKSLYNVKFNPAINARNVGRRIHWNAVNRVRKASGEEVAEYMSMSIDEFVDMYASPFCATCHVRLTQFDGWLPTRKETHHIEPISTGGLHDLDNTLMLCHGCHVDIHRRMRELEAVAA